MRIVSRRMLREFWAVHPEAQAPLTHWYSVTKAAEWRSFVDLRASFPHADQVTVGRRVVVTVFNIGGNNYRLIAKVEYRWQTVYTLMVLTHEEYDRGHWKERLCTE